MAGCFRKKKGADYFARIQAFIATARKHAKSAFDEIINALIGDTIIAQLYPHA